MRVPRLTWPSNIPPREGPVGKGGTTSCRYSLGVYCVLGTAPSTPLACCHLIRTPSREAGTVSSATLEMGVTGGWGEAPAGGLSLNWGLDTSDPKLGTTLLEITANGPPPVESWALLRGVSDGSSKSRSRGRLLPRRVRCALLLRAWHHHTLKPGLSLHTPCNRERFL